jgi:hypothetical protein
MRHLLLLCALFIIVVTANADGIEKIIKSTEIDTLYKDSHKVLLFDSISADVKESGLSYVIRKQLFYAIDENGASDLHQVTYDYDPLSAYVEIRKAVIYRKDGTQEILDSTHFYDFPQPARMIYWGARQKMVEFGKINPGDAIYIELFRKGFTYALLYNSNDDKYIPPMKGHYYDIVKFYEPFPIHRKVFKTAIPTTKKIQYETFNADFEVKTEKNGKQIFAFKLEQIIPPKREPNMVGMDDIIPKVLITTSPDWEAKSKWFYGVNEDFGSFESTPEIDKKVAGILEGATSEIDSIARLTHWCADEIRYSGISMGEGEGYTLHTGDMTFTDRCGVCKDKAGMLITMLRAAGFESYAAMTMAGSRIEDIPADQFNHSITVVKRRNGEYEVLDPTWVPFVRELWSSREQQQNYLMGLPEGADLMITDISSPENHYLKITNNGNIDDKGTLTGTLEVTAEGQSDAAVRGIFTYYYKSLWQANLEAELTSVFPQAQIKNITYTDPYKYADQPVKIVYEYTIPEFAIVYEGDYMFNSLTNKGFMHHNRFAQSLRKSQKERKYGYRMRCSQAVEIVETFQLPGKVKEISTASEELKTQPAEVKIGWEKQKNQVSFGLNARFAKRKYEAESWPEMKKVLDVIDQFEKEPVIVKVK